MKRSELEHVIRAAGHVVRDSELIVFGSQAILGSFPNAPAELLVSNEVDVYPKNRVEGADFIDGTIGERSSFHTTFGYYGHGVSPEIATLPDRWGDRLVPVLNENTNGITGWCLEVHDLAISKLAAGRQKDLDYLAALIRHTLVDLEVLQNRLAKTAISESQKNLFGERLLRLFRENTK